MAKVALLVPYQEMCKLAQPIINQYTNITVMSLEYIQTAEVEARVRELEEQGCELIIARGVHARIVKHSVKVPLVEIRVTAQELGMVMLDIKRELGEEYPRIGLLGFDNMFCDTKPFNALFGIDLHTYLVDRGDELAPAVDQAVREGCQAVVGGDIVCAYAKAIGLPNRFIPAGLESLQTAMETASRVCYAIDLERHNTAEMDTMLNYTFTGIMRADREGTILRVNRTGCDLLGLAADKIAGHKVTEVLPGLTEKTLEDVLERGEEVYASLLDVQHHSVVVNLAPVQVDGETDGAIITFQEGQRVIEMNSHLRQELYQQGYIARYKFGKIISKSREAQALERLAKRISKYDAPILLTGETGSGKKTLAQCIHNESLQRRNAYIWADCSAWSSETLDTMLFGNHTTRKDTPACMAELAQDGTLFLGHVEVLTPELQYKLYNLIRGHFLHNGSNRPTSAKVRVIASTEANLAAWVEDGKFRSDLYYTLSALSLEVPPLRQRREDIPGLAEVYIKEWQRKYKRYVHLTQDALKFMQDYSWPGNLEQLNNVCERIVLMTEKRDVNELFVRKQLEQIAPKHLRDSEKIVLYKDPKAVELAELLRKHNGNRAAAATDLGISKTTLWRYIKKYGIEKDFTV